MIPLSEGKEATEREFERPCVGLRPGCGFENALRGESKVLQMVRELALTYTKLPQVFGKSLRKNPQP